jgi:hypothetical protein
MQIMVVSSNCVVNFTITADKLQKLTLMSIMNLLETRYQKNKALNLLTGNSDPDSMKTLS